MYPSANRDFITVGMPDTAVRESRQRIKSALMNSGFGYPNKGVTINLAPANVRKEGAGFDLPMALGILGAMGVITLPSTLTNPFSLELNQTYSAGICVVTSGATNVIVIFD